MKIPVSELLECLVVGRSSRVVIEQKVVEKVIIDKISASRSSTVDVPIEIQNIKSIIVTLRRFTKNVTKGGKQKQLLRNKAATKPPLTVHYLLGDQATKAFVSELQQTVYDLENRLEKQKRKGLLTGKSPRTVRRYTARVLSELKSATGEEYALVPKQSPRKTTVTLDQAGVSLRKYRRLKGKHQPSVEKVTIARRVLNEDATDMSLLLKHLVGKCKCDGPAKIKVSVDGHDPTRNIKTVTFSFSLVCEPAAQSAELTVPVVSIPGAESYDLVRDSGVWSTIQSELKHELTIDDREHRVEYYLCADLKSLLLYLGFKAANARDCCIYCSCSKGRWGRCCEDGKCVGRYVTKGGLTLPPLQPGDPGYKQPPLIDVTLYRFVIIDVLHMFLRVTDQMFSRACGFMSRGQLDQFMIECRHIGLKSFHLKDDNDGLKFSNLDKRKRERMMQDIFLSGVLYTLVPASRAELVVQVMRRFLDMWREIDSDTPDTSRLTETVVAFTLQFQKTYACVEPPNYVHMLCRLPLLVAHFGSLKAFQQQRVEALNHVLNQKVRTVTRPGPGQMTEAVQAVIRSLLYPGQ